MSTADTVNQFLQRLASQDADGIGALFDDDIEWSVPGDSKLPWVGERSKREDVPAYFRTMWPAFTPGLSIVSVDALLIDGEDAAVFARFSHVANSTGRRFETPSALHIVVRGGKITKLQLYEDTAVVSRAFADT